MKNNQEFQQFQRDHVRLNKTRYDELNQHMQALDSYLSSNHPGFRMTERQGSHALRTIIRPTTDDAKADADILVLVRKDSNDCKTYVPALVETLESSERYQDKVLAKTRCVTIQYNEASKCEVDLVPCVERNGKFYVCPKDGKDFEQTDGSGYRDWFNDKNRATAGNLRRIVRLLKYVRDHHTRLERCPSIILTTLAAETITNGDQDTVAVSTQADTLVTVLSRMAANLDKMPYPLSIRNPALQSETFDPHWTRAEYNRFRTTIRTMAKDAQDALEAGKEESIAKWQKVCGEKFTVTKGGQNEDNRASQGPSQNTGRHTAAAASIPIARRPNEARPFG